MTEVPYPRLRRANGWTSISAFPISEYGFGTIRGMTKFVEEAQKYERKIYVKNAFLDEWMDLKSIMQAMVAETHRGDGVTFLIEGQDEKAEHIALRLYSGATSEKIYEPDFDRYDRACPWAHS